MAQINDYTAEATIIDSDQYILQKTAGGLTKKTLWSTIKSTLKTYFDALYSPIGGGGVTSKTITAATYTVLDADMTGFNIIEFDTTSNSIVVTLPDRATNDDYKIILKHSIKSGSNIVTINRAGSDTITQDVLTSIELPSFGNYIEVFASSTASNWEILTEVVDCEIDIHTSDGAGSTDTAIEKFTTMRNFIGNFMSHNHGSYGTAGLEVTINRSGVFSINYSTNYNAAADIGISKNSSQLTTRIQSINVADKLQLTTSFSSTNGGSVSATSICAKGDIIRPHDITGKPGTGADANCLFTVVYQGQ